MAKGVVQGIVDELKREEQRKEARAKELKAPVDQFQLFVAGLPESSDVEGDMAWAYRNISIEYPDWSKAPSKSCRFMWEYARSARSEFLTRYMAVSARASEREKQAQDENLDTARAFGVIDGILKALPKVIPGSLDASEMAVLVSP